MQQFIPFEDDWDVLESLRPEALIPYRVGLVPVHQATPTAPTTDANPPGEPLMPIRPARPGRSGT